MARAKIPTNTYGPAIRCVDPWAPSAGKMRQFLSAEERARLSLRLSDSTKARKSTVKASTLMLYSTYAWLLCPNGFTEAERLSLNFRAALS
jgi:hypothetical protein